MVDHLGRIVDGDQLLYVLACARQAAGELRGPVVGTAMSNLGLELALRERGIDFRRAAVGDRYVLQMLRDEGGILGGETSGHLLCLDKATTGDGLIAALQVLGVMRQSGKSLAELAAGMERFPQKLVNVRVRQRFEAAAHAQVAAVVAAAERALAGRGRVVLRASGTEPVIRVMVEGEDDAVVAAALGRVRPEIVLCGNLDAAKLCQKGTPQAGGEQARALLEATRSALKNFVVSSGRDIPPGSPLANLNAFFRAVAEFNK